MNTRSFIKSMLLAAVAPQLILNAASPIVRVKRIVPVRYMVNEMEAMLNPEWVNAEYEMAFISQFSYGILPVGSPLPILFKRETNLLLQS